MKQYKLINKTTGEETICTKVVIDGFDYYFSNDNPKHKDYYWDENKNDIRRYFESRESYPSLIHRYKVICCNNPSINIGQVIDEVEKLAMDNCYNRHQTHNSEYTHAYIVGYNTHASTHTLSDDEVVDFKDWCLYIPLGSGLENKTTKELLELFKEQLTKTIYYNE